MAGASMERRVDAQRSDLKPLVLLDIDGVINAYPNEGTEAYKLAWARMAVFIGEDTVEALKTIFERAADVLWCTAWRERANVEPMEFLRDYRMTDKTHLGVITDGGSFGTWNTGWKLEAVKKSDVVKQAVQDGRPVYWIEDFGWGAGGYRHVGFNYTDIIELGITPIDTVGNKSYARLRPEHLAGTALESTTSIIERVEDEEYVNCPDGVCNGHGAHCVRSRL